MLDISSYKNPRVKSVSRLKKASARKEEGLIIIDGQREILEAVKAGQEITQLFYCPELAAGFDRQIQDFQALGIKAVVQTGKSVFMKMCYKENPDGFLAIAKRPELSLSKIKLSNTPFIVILESVEKPGNLGAIIRTAYAAGVEAIIINDSQTDVYNPNVIRASEGLIFSQPIALASVDDTIFWLKNNGVKSFAAATSASQAHWQAKLSDPIALVFGSEADGLSNKWLKSVDGSLKIPMRPEVDSLNVSVSAAVIIYEAKRQREE